MEKLIPFHDAHRVTATEAAYAGLFGCIIPRIGWRWFQAADWPQLPWDNGEAWVVETMSVGMASAAGAEYEGKILTLFAPWPYGQGITELHHGLYNWGKRVTLPRPAKVVCGVGVYIRNPVAIDTDVIDVNVLVRKL